MVKFIPIYVPFQNLKLSPLSISPLGSILQRFGVGANRRVRWSRLYYIYHSPPVEPVRNGGRWQTRNPASEGICLEGDDVLYRIHDTTPITSGAAVGREAVHSGPRQFDVE